MLSEDKDYETDRLLRECLAELEEKGFLNLTGNSANEYLVQIRDQKQKLKFFISNELKNHGKPLSFDLLSKMVAKQFDNFYTKDFIFKSIDELFQMGLIYEVSKCTYAYLA